LDIGKRPWITIAIGILLVVFALLSGEALAMQLERLNGEIGLNKIIISPIYSSGYKRQDRIEVEELEKLRAKMSGQLVSFSTSEKAVAEFEENSIDVVVDAVDASYAKFRHLNFIKGGHWSAFTDTEQGMVAVIDAETALRLFGSIDVVGMALEISDEKYRIVGVVQGKASIINKLFNDGSCHVYIPFSSLMEKNRELGIREIQIADSGDGGMDRSEVEAALRYIGEAPGEYNIMDFRKKSRQLHQKSKLIILFIGLLIEVMLFKLGRRIALKALMLIKEGCKSDYLMNTLKKQNKELLGALAFLITLLCAAVFIGLTIRFDLYIPANVIPDELTDLAFWGELAESKLQEALESLKQYRTFTDIQFSRVSKLQNFIYTVFVPLGFILLYSAHSNIRPDRRNIVRNVTLLSVVLVPVFSLLILLLGLTGLPVSLSFHSLFIPLVFVFLKILIFFSEEEDLRC